MSEYAQGSPHFLDPLTSLLSDEPGGRMTSPDPRGLTTALAPGGGGPPAVRPPSPPPAAFPPAAGAAKATTAVAVTAGAGKSLDAWTDELLAACPVGVPSPDGVSASLGGLRILARMRAWHRVAAVARGLLDAGPEPAADGPAAAAAAERLDDTEVTPAPLQLLFGWHSRGCTTGIIRLGAPLYYLYYGFSIR